MRLDTWTLVCGRGAFTTLGVAVIMVGIARWHRKSLRTLLGSTGTPGIAFATLSAGANLLFVFAIGHTSVANTLVILAALPLLAAVLSRVFLDERVPPETWWASLIAVGAISVIFSRSLSSAGLSGDIAAVVATFLAAANITITRRYRTRSMVPGIAGAGLISALALGPFADFSSITGNDALWLVLNGLILIPVSLSLLIVAPRYIPAPAVAMFYLLETVLGPVWVWLVVGEVPPKVTVIAGVTLVTLIAAHSTIQVVRQRRLELELESELLRFR